MQGKSTTGTNVPVDTEAGRVVDDDELKREVTTQYPYAEWLRNNQVSWRISSPPETPVQNSSTLLQQQQAFGYTSEELKLLITPMGATAKRQWGRWVLILH